MGEIRAAVLDHELFDLRPGIFVDSHLSAIGTDGDQAIQGFLLLKITMGDNDDSSQDNHCCQEGGPLDIRWPIVEQSKRLARPYSANQEKKSHALPEGNVIQGKSNYGMLWDRFFHTEIVAERDKNAIRV